MSPGSANVSETARTALASPPVLLVIFNRPDVLAQLVEAIRPARPARLYVAADGPRAAVPTDVQRCAAARAVLDQVDWPCQITRRFHDDNVGLQVSMVGAIDWFFEHVDAGIILEDDCLVHPDFFPFAAEVLERYRDDRSVMAISALNMAPQERFGRHSYFFASAGHIWGWATWGRAWEGYDVDLTDWPNRRDEFLEGATPLERALARKFDAASDGRKNTWARSWHHHVAVRRGLVVVPSANLVHNVGFGPDATHTTSLRHSLGGLPVGRLPLPLDHPDELAPSAAYNDRLARFHTWTTGRRIRERAAAISGVIRRRSASATRWSPRQR